MRISQIWQYPVKSMMGETVPSARLAPLGIEGDRRWAARDLERGGLRGAKKLNGLMRLAARTVDGGPDAEITLPDGTTVHTSDPTVHERVSAAIGHEVRLEALRPATDLDHYRNGPPDHDDLLTEVRAVMGREDDEPLPDFSVFPPEIFEFSSPPGTYYDAYPLMVMTTSSLRTLAESLPGSAIDVRRFRPSFVIDTGDEPGHPELSWPRGRRLAIGGAVIEVVAPCPRCVMPTLEIDASLPADRAILRHIVRDLDQNLGVYATVAVAGEIHAGDEVVGD